MDFGAPYLGSSPTGFCAPLIVYVSAYMALQGGLVSGYHRSPSIVVEALLFFVPPGGGMLALSARAPERQGTAHMISTLV